MRRIDGGHGRPSAPRALSRFRELLARKERRA
jgi:hypothetical protein